MHTILLPSSRQARFVNASRYPNEAALLAHIPLVRHRVPMNTYWRRRAVDPVDLGREMIASAPFTGGRLERFVISRNVRRRIERASDVAFSGADEAASRAREFAPDIAPRKGRRRATNGLVLTFASIGAGALLMYYIDPELGRRRRALVRDQLTHVRHVFTSDIPRRAEQRGRFFRGVARGVRHNALSPLRNGHEIEVDDETLVDRVRSEVLRSRDIHPGEINLDAYEGTVTLRGQLQHQGQIRELIEATGDVEGVRRVRSYLHLPGTIAPNKAEIYDLEQAPSTTW
ncbi:MAG TPA: BON domain-containing protein [Dehalococcoidia bacterium]|nr:BON domain-containing protein [Dehalococcoidia bacterium]